MIKFSEREFDFPVTVRHQGIVLVLASERDSNQIHYRVLDVRPDVPDDDKNWSGIKRLDFPESLRPAGMSLVSRPVYQVEKADAAPFRALSDGRYVFTFRQSVDGTLLVDRFVFDRGSATLKGNYEARYQRSRKKDIPANRKDSLDFVDMENEPFPEPTLELELSAKVESGNFAVLLLPTAIPDQTRWLIIAGNRTKGVLFDTYSIRRSPDGLFDLGDIRETNFNLSSYAGDLGELVPGAGLDAVIYAQQELMKDDYGRDQKVKRSQRVMVAYAVKSDRWEKPQNEYIAILDFAISQDGGLTRIPDEGHLDLPLLVLDSAPCVPATLLEDIQGLELRGGLFYVRIGSAPRLLEGADGLVHLYFCHAEAGEYTVLQYDTTTARARINLPLIPKDKGAARLTAFRPGAAMNSAVLTISLGEDDDHCQVKLEVGAGDTYTCETWRDVPRRLDRFAAVLNGDTTTDEQDPRVEKGELAVYDSASKRQFTSKRHAYLAYDIPAGIGAVRAETWQPVVQEQEGVIIAVTNSTKPELCTVTLQLDMAPPDAETSIVKEVWTDVPREPLKMIQMLSGSNLFKFTDRGASGDLQDQAVEQRAFDFAGSMLFGVVTEVNGVQAPQVRVNNDVHTNVAEAGIDAHWIPELLGWALGFEEQQHLPLTADKLPLERFRGDLTLEAWVKMDPDTTSDSLLRILHFHEDDRTRFFFGLKAISSSNLDAPAYLPYAASRDVVVIADQDQDEKNRMQPGEWNHVAATFNATNALNLDGKGYVDIGNEDALRLTEAITIEGWVERAEAGRREMVASKWGEREEDQSWKLYIDSDDRPGFTVRDSVHRRNITVKAFAQLEAGQSAHIAGVFDAIPRKETALALDGVDDHVTIIKTGLKKQKDKQLDHTIEAWIWLDEYPKKDEHFCILNLGSVANTMSRSDHSWEVDEWGYMISRAAKMAGALGDKLPLKTWTHIAVSCDSKKMLLFVNGVRLGYEPKNLLFSESNNVNFEPTLNVGYVNTTIKGYKNFPGKINNLRVWDKALSEEKVRESMFKSTSEITGPVGHWPFDEVDKLLNNNKASDRAGKNDGDLKGNPEFVPVDKGLYRQQIYVDGEMKESKGHFYGGSWSWVYFGKNDLTLGGIYDNDKLVVFPPINDLIPGDVIAIPTADSSEVQEQMEVEELIPGNPTGGLNPLIKVHRPVHGTWVTHHNKLEKIFHTRNPNEAILDDDLKNGFKLAAIQDTDAHVCIGSTSAGTENFKGKIDDVRLWNTGRFQWQILQSVEGESPKKEEKGLVAWWPFEEGRGTTALDSKGSLHGRLRHPEKKALEDGLWAPSDRNAKWALYLNGEKLNWKPQELTDLEGYGDPNQFWLGGRIGAQEDSKSLVRFIDEVRIWGQNRTQEQIKDNMYRALDGAEESLLAYWRMENVEEDIVYDLTGNGQDGVISNAREKPTWEKSDAPISNEAPQVKNAYQGSFRRMNKQISGAPATAEYGDMQYDDEGNLFGVMKRCYIYPVDGGIEMVTGFKIGDLELNFVGQVQTAPTLVGYIEGPPPVPSENLTVGDPDGDDYVGASSVKLAEAEQSTQIYSASRDTGLDVSVDIKAGMYNSSEAAAGLGVQSKIFSADSKFGAHAHFEHSQSWLTSSQVSSSTATTLTNTLSLRGAWEQQGDYDHNGKPRYLNEEVGRRYVPNNMGYALVKSTTADLFALRLKRDGSLVAYQIQPNPDIPEDWNVIMFPLNPKYTKNGTLDGMVGLVPDPDYPLASDGERGSYFKPLEAYALKARIDREARQIEGYYDRYDAPEVSGYAEIGSDGDAFSEYMPGEQELGYDRAAKSSKRSLVNTYVWKAEGGFFAEETQFSTIKQESKGGAYHFLGQVGLYTDFKLAVGAGIFMEADTLFGRHINTTLSQTREQSAAYGVKVDVSGEGFINRWIGDPDRKSGYYAPEPGPGKVDGYRFMTFYLAPGHDHFEKFFDRVVDPNWLYERGPYSGQYLPDARALRQAKNYANAVWRVMHRVTFVSRIPPKFKEKSLESRPKEARRPDNIEANIALIEEIELAFDQLYPDENIREGGLVKLGTAVEAWLKKIQHQPWGKDLDMGLGQDILTYLKNYYEMDQPESSSVPEPPIEPVKPTPPLPEYSISSPSPGSSVKGRVVIRGKMGRKTDAVAENKVRWYLQILGGQMSGWRTIAQGGVVAASGGVLGRLDTNKYEPGDYRLRLLVINGNQNQPFVVPITIRK